MWYLVADHFSSQHSHTSVPMGVDMYLPAEKEMADSIKCWLNE